ncbi:unnamed protein product [Chilo suppressalis]|uniref:Follicular epithelium yolk protein subunit n=1 Tax=Chilo suppressalis TaxID=168631 RepID=A0ABN8BBE6_CHISP|nr:unnamed protein product [Chilo suppressalis]
MALRFIVLLLPALAVARINVELSGKFDAQNPNMQVYLSGNDVGIITDTERETFNVRDGSLKDAVRANFGKRPDDAYLRSPTPWGDLYQSYGWSQVTRTLIPKKATILGIVSQPTIVMQQIFENNSSKPATFNVGISQEVANTVSSSWSKGGSLSIGQEINYSFDIEVASGGGSTSIDYTNSWGESTEKSETVTVGASTAMDILLQPGQSVMAQLHATKGTIKIEVEYEASLSGDTAINYSSPYQGHHFWALDVGAVMSSGGISNRLVSRETIEIGFYSQSSVSVQDRNYATQMMMVKF